MQHLLALSLLALSLSLACDASPDAANATPVDSLTLRPGYVIDSILPMDEMLRRFRAPLGPPPDSLASAAPSRDALASGFVRALAAGDSVALGAMHLSRAEFAWLYFPTSKFARPPYALPPEVLWMQIAGESNKGITRALRLFEHGGTYLGHSCDEAPEIQGENRLWNGCAVRWRTADGMVERYRLFGTILERNGRFKLVSFANGL